MPNQLNVAVYALLPRVNSWVSALGELWYDSAWDQSKLLQWAFRAALRDHASGVLEDAKTAQTRLTDF